MLGFSLAWPPPIDGMEQRSSKAETGISVKRTHRPWLAIRRHVPAWLRSAEEKSTAAVLIQAAGRGMIERRGFGRQRDAVAHEQWLKYYLSIGAFYHARQLGWVPVDEHAAAARIQAAWHGMVHRRRLRTRLEAEAHATWDSYLITQGLLGHAVRLGWAPRPNLRVAAAKIQAAVRARRQSRYWRSLLPASPPATLWYQLALPPLPAPTPAPTRRPFACLAPTPAPSTASREASLATADESDDDFVGTEDDTPWLREADKSLRQQRLVRQSAASGTMATGGEARCASSGAGTASAGTAAASSPSQSACLPSEVPPIRTRAGGVNPFLAQHRWIADAIAKDTAADDTAADASSATATQMCVSVVDIYASSPSASSPSSAESAAGEAVHETRLAEATALAMATEVDETARAAHATEAPPRERTVSTPARSAASADELALLGEVLSSAHLRAKGEVLSSAHRGRVLAAARALERSARGSNSP